MSVDVVGSRSVPSLLKFTLVCQELGLDGFLFLLPGQVYAADVQVRVHA